jgi:hypothetical protein
MQFWSTTTHAVSSNPQIFGVTELFAPPALLITAELTRLTSYCGFIQANGSGFGICRSCHLGAEGGQ